MKSPKTSILVGIIISAFILQGCLTIFSGSRYKVERDRVLGTTRIRANMGFKKALEKRTSFVKLQKTFIKEKDVNSTISYRVYDVLYLNRESFGLRNEIAIIIDNTPFVIFPETFETTLLGAQANGVAQGTAGQLPTGLFEHRTFRVNYNLDESLIGFIQNAQEVFFRYYAGPDVISVKLTRTDLRYLKRMIEQTI